MKKFLKMLFKMNANEASRDRWLKEKLLALPGGLRILDAGAGELRNKALCTHLVYVSQDICEYKGQGNGQGIQTGSWDTSRVDLVCDITNIPEPDASFDIILCSEVFEHIPDPVKALDEFERLLKPGGKLIITAPFCSLVHFAPYHYASGFSRYWYEYHLPSRRFEIVELIPNGDWFSLYRQDVQRLPGVARRYGDWCWPIAYIFSLIQMSYFVLRGGGDRENRADLGCVGWHCIAVKSGDF